MDKALHLRLLLHKKESASLVRERRTHNQEHHHAAILQLPVIPIPILHVYVELGEQTFRTAIRQVTPAQVCGRSGF